MWTEESFMHHNTATHDSGGAIFITSSPTGIRNVSLVGNHAPAGGAVSSVSSQLNLTDCLISDNVAVYTHGGAVLHDAIDNMSEELLMTRCTVANNSCNGGGGAVAALESLAVVLTSCLFEGNSITASAPAGGAVYAQDVGDLVLRNSTFLHNTVQVVPALAEDAPLGYVSGVAALGFGLGGAVWVGSNDPVRATVLGSNFTRNYAASGGAIYATGLAHLTVQWSDFTHDHATDWDGRGGAVVTDSTAVAEVLDTYFYSCEANRGGVGWHGGTSVTTYTRCFFEENEGIEGDDMKGMALQVTDAASLIVTGSTFLRNFGPPLAEGTIALAGTNSSRLNVTNTVFDSNVAHLGACLFIVRACLLPAWPCVRVAWLALTRAPLPRACRPCLRRWSS
jgi:predicted outer membrane repeat protein